MVRFDGSGFSCSMMSWDAFQLQFPKNISQKITVDSRIGSLIEFHLCQFTLYPISSQNKKNFGLFCWIASFKVAEFPEVDNLLLTSISSGVSGILFINPWKDRSSHPEVFLVKGVLKKCIEFTGEHPCRNVISIKLLKQIYWNHT